MTVRHGSQRPDQERHPTERQNEYFIPGDGIMREVIQADICRYLGNDALVRPGNYQVRLLVTPDTQQMTANLSIGSTRLLHKGVQKSH